MTKKNNKQIQHCLSVFFLMVFIMLNGCSNVRVPKKFATCNEAYTQTFFQKLPEDIPIDSQKSTVFPVPYDDVFRALEVGMTQAGLNIESVNQDEGYILATLTKRIPNANKGFDSATRVYFFCAIAEEEAAARTRVLILSKNQDSCLRTSGGFWTGASILSFGILAPAAAVGYPLEKSSCDKAATLRWSEGEDNCLEEIGRILNFDRNNLIAAGLL